MAPAPLQKKKELWPAVGARFHWAIILTLGTIVLLTYANSFSTGFALDNKFIILEDPRLRQPTKDNVKLVFEQDYWWPKAVSGLYRPLTTLSYMLNYSVLDNKDRATGYHWINFLLHWVNTVLVYFLVLVLMEKLWPAFFVAALFATHPVVTESVTNIIGRADLFATAAILGGFLCYAKSTTGEENRKPQIATLAAAIAVSVVATGFVVASALAPGVVPASLSNWQSIAGALILLALGTIWFAAQLSGFRRIPWLSGLVVITLLGVFCKESAVAVLGVMGLYDFTYRLQQKEPTLLHHVLSAAAALFVLVYAWWALGVGIALIVTSVIALCILLLALFRSMRSLEANLWTWFGRGYVALIPSFVALWYVRSQVFEKLRPPELPWVDNPLAMPGVDFWTARLTAIKIIGQYLWLLVWPQTLSCDYSYNQIPIVNWHFNTWEDIKALIALLMLIAILIVAIRQYHRNKAVFFFILFAFGTFLPTANLLRIIGSIMAERFMYTPTIGFVGCVVVAAYALCRKAIPKLDVSEWAQRIWLQVVARSALCLVTIGYGARAFIRNFDWTDDERLWSSAVVAVPNSFKSHKSLAFALYEKDSSPRNKELDRIIEEGEKALKITDKTQIVLLHLGAYYQLKGDALAQQAPDGSLIATPASMEWYRKSVEVLRRAVPLDKEFNDDNRQKEIKRGRNPDLIQDIGNHEIYWNLGLSNMRLGQQQDAIEAYLYMRHLSPTNPDAYLSIASVLLAAGRVEDAIINLLQALLLDSNRQDALSTLVGIYRQVDREGCAVVFSQNQPRLNAQCPLVHGHICTAYAGLAQVFLETRNPPLAQQTVDNAIKNYACPPETFQVAPAPAPAPAQPATAPATEPPPVATNTPPATPNNP